MVELDRYTDSFCTGVSEPFVDGLREVDEEAHG